MPGILLSSALLLFKPSSLFGTVAPPPPSLWVCAFPPELDNLNWRLVPFFLVDRQVSLSRRPTTTMPRSSSEPAWLNHRLPDKFDPFPGEKSSEDARRAVWNALGRVLQEAFFKEHNLPLRTPPETCRICLEPMWRYNLTLRCEHKFHRACITRLALCGVRADCPLCNEEIRYLPPNVHLPTRTVPQFEKAVRREVWKLNGKEVKCAERNCRRRGPPIFCANCVKPTCCGQEVGGGTYCTLCLSRLHNCQTRASDDARPATLEGPVYKEVLLPVNHVGDQELTPTVITTSCPFRFGRQGRRS